MEKVKRYPWLYLVLFDGCPFAVYATAWRALACLVCIVKEGFSVKNIKVVRYRLSSSVSVETEREDVTDSFIKSMKKYEG